MNAHGSRLNRMVVAFLVLWVAMETALTVSNGMSDVWSRWPFLGAAVVSVLLFVGLFRLAGGRGWSAAFRDKGQRWTRGNTIMMVIIGLTIVIGLGGSHGFRGNLPALVLVGLLAALPMVVAVVVYLWWWRPRAAVRAAAAERADD